MRIPELFGRGKPVFSFEFFLPKEPGDTPRFKRTVRELKELGPSFVTITYGAGGTAPERTIETAGTIKNELGIETAAHLTCIAHTRAELRSILARIRSYGIENIVALRGDPPRDTQPLPPEKREVPYARDLVRIIRSDAGAFAVAVAGYPERHPEAPSKEEDLARLKDKVDAGGDWIITQLFFDNADYFDFVERAREIGIRCPIVPGIMPVTSFKQIRKFTTMCGASLPRKMIDALTPISDDKDAVARYGVEYATRQCRELLEGGAPGIHFYTLNKSQATATVLSNLRKG
ncbi:MAG: methylenetetrahydrofolate reductase [NAD(P)H] [Elusimicrobiota bacterium]